MRTCTKGCAAALALSAASLAQAGQFDLDLTGFTVTIAGSGDAWIHANLDGIYTAAVNDDGAGGYLPGPGPLGTVSSIVVEPAGSASLGAGPGSGIRQLYTGISYTVRPKPGWELASVAVHGYLSGTYREADGGLVTIDGAGNGGLAGGADKRDGYWSYQVEQLMGGSQGFAPGAAVAGDVGVVLGAASNGPDQMAAVDTYYGSLQLTVLAFAARPIPAVPEPAPYAMLGVSLGLIGCMARRHRGSARGRGRPAFSRPGPE